MRQLSAKFLLMMSVMAALFFACGDDDDGIDILPPTISASDDAASVAVGATVDVSFSITAPGGFATADVAPNDASIATTSIRTQGTVGENNTTVVVTVTGVAEGETAITLTVEDQQDQQATDDVTITVNPAPDEPDNPDEPTTAITTVVDTVVALEELSSLEAAISAAEGNLATVLAGDGPFTVFAPNNAAFEKLLRDLSAEEVSQIDAVVLQQVLLAHVVSGDSLGAAELTDGQTLTTTNDSTLLIAKSEAGAVTVNGAAVVTADIQVSNGVVHIIDSVVNNGIVAQEPLPEEAITVADTIASRDELNSLETALAEADLVTTLNNTGPFTVFAPNNAAFDALLAGRSLDQLVTDLGGPEALADILQAHVIQDKIMAADILDKDVYNTLNGATLTAEVSGTTVLINGAEVVATDLVAENGVVHIIDQVVNTTAANDGSNGFTVTIQNVSSAQRYFQHGVFGEAPAGPGESYTFTFHAGPELLLSEPTKLMFATMLVASNDLFFAPGENGIPLYTGGVALNGDITNRVQLWDAGTEANEAPGGANQPGQQEEDNTGEGETAADGAQAGTVRPYNDPDYTYPAVSEMIQVSIDGSQAPFFTVTISNVSGGSAVSTPLSPGVYGVHTVPTPLFKTNNAARDGLEALAEDGNPAPASQVMDANEGFAVPLSAGVYAIHGENSRPFLVTGEADRGEGLEALAEEGDNSTLATTLANGVTTGALKASGQFVSIAPGESLSFDVDNVVAGDRLNLVTMMGQSNDIVYASGEIGIPLFLSNGNPFIGNAKEYIVAYDVGTEVNEYPGAGLNQPIRSSVGAGTPENGTVTRVKSDDRNPSEDGFVYRPVGERIIVTITPK